jgi:hypothetical protein
MKPDSRAVTAYMRDLILQQPSQDTRVHRKQVQAFDHVNESRHLLRMWGKGALPFGMPPGEGEPRETEEAWWKHALLALVLRDQGECITSMSMRGSVGYLVTLSSSMALVGNDDSAKQIHARRPRQGQTPPVAPVSSFLACVILLCLDLYIGLSFCINADIVLRSPPIVSSSLQAHSE